MNPDLTAGESLIWVNISYNIGYLKKTQADERADDKSLDWREKG